MKNNSVVNEDYIMENEESEVHNLLAGYKDEEGVIHTEFEIREMTGVEEEVISKPEIKSNGGKVINTLLERCCTRIGSYTRKEVGNIKWKNIIQNLISGDQDYILLQIRKQSIGEELELTHQCPNPECKAKLETKVALDELEIVHFKGDYEIHFELPKGYKDRQGNIHRSGVLHLPKGLDREILDPMARKNLGQANTLMLTRCIKSLGTIQVTNEIMRKLSIKDRDYLFTLLKDNMCGVQPKVKVECVSCLTEFEGSLNATNFI